MDAMLLKAALEEVRAEGRGFSSIATKFSYTLGGLQERNPVAIPGEGAYIHSDED